MNDMDNLQEKMAYQEREIEQLSDALAKQQLQMSRLQEEVNILAQLLREWRAESRPGDGDAGNQIAHEIPPHY